MHLRSHHSTAFLTVFLVCNFLLSSFSSPLVCAQSPGNFDQIWFQPPARTSSDSGLVPRPIEKISGKVAEADATAFKVEAPTATNATFIAVERIVWLRPAWTNEQAAQGMQDFEAGKYAEAIDNLFNGIKSGPPVWQQQWLLVHLAQAAFEVERFGPVLQLVSDFSSSRPPETFLGLLPIQWSSRGLPGSAIAEARSKIDSSDPLVRLVAASWLLSSADDRTLAERTLEALVADRTNRVISVYAEALRWRRTPVPEIPKLADDWIQSVDRLPIMLQPGPLFTIGDRLQAAGQQERARELFQSVALLHKQPRPLADQAQRELDTANK